MSDVSFTYSDGGLTKTLESLQGKDFRRIEKRAMRRGASVIKRQTVSNFKKDLPASTQSSEKYSDRLIDAVRSTVYEENNEVYFSVHVMGSRKKDSGTFRARFFERGTKERNKDNHNRGQIQPLNFFSNAVSQSGAKAVNAINQTFTKEVQKIIDSKKEEVKI